MKILGVALLVLLVAAQEATVAPSPSSPGRLPGHQHAKFQGKVGPTSSELLRYKRERFFKWLTAVGCVSAPFEWRDEGVAGEHEVTRHVRPHGSQGAACLHWKTWCRGRWAPFR